MAELTQNGAFKAGTDAIAKGWSETNVPALRTLKAVVTGTGGLGYETARVLAQKGADVILAGRNAVKGAASVAQIRALQPAGTVTFAELDLGSLASVRAFAQRLKGETDALNILVNNAGVMAPPQRETTRDGFELQLGTNYLGHFALTAELRPLLKNATGARVVNLSSLAHRNGRIFFDDLQAERRYKPWAWYGQSKLAMLLFAFELQRRSEAHGWRITSNAAHPGFSRTDLIANGPGRAGFDLTTIASNLLKQFASHSAAAGALPTLFAATAAQARGGAYYGPDGFYELKGSPKLAYVAPQARDSEVAKRLWTTSEELTGAAFV